MTACTCDAVRAAYATHDPSTLELEARCILNNTHLNVKEAHQRVVNTLVAAQCWSEPPQRFVRVDRLFANDVRVSASSINDEVAVKKTALVTSDLPPRSEFWNAPANCPQYRIRLSRETPTNLPGKKQVPKHVRRKDTLSCLYKTWRFDVSLVNQGGDQRLELEIECQSLDHEQHLTQQHLIMKLTDLVQMAFNSPPTLT
jgi:hypothetical protein